MAIRLTPTATSILFSIVASALIGASVISVEARPTSRGSLDFTSVVENAKPPKGWDAFCNRYSFECDTKSSEPREIKLTSETWNTILRANAWVNKNIKPMTDMRHWGTVNKWVYPDDGFGDCKGYALLKRRRLMEIGFPQEALLLTIVWTKQRKGHVVLIVRTDKGDFVLDNLSSKIVLWSKTSHDFVKRQSQTDPNIWVYIDRYHQKRPMMATKKD